MYVKSRGKFAGSFLNLLTLDFIYHLWDENHQRTCVFLGYFVDYQSLSSIGYLGLIKTADEKKGCRIK
jgi:hypothetical protein